MRFLPLRAATMVVTAIPASAQRGGGDPGGGGAGAGRGGRGAMQTPSVPLPPNPKADALKKEAIADVDRMATFTQQMVDQIFSYGELGFHEVETSKYITKILRDNGFTVQEGVAGIPTAWIARWGSGKPVVAIGSDIDGIPQASQKPGVAYHDPIVPGAPGHGEGHNTGQPLNVTAIIAVKKLMERDRIPGTIIVWPGVAEEQLGAKAHLIRAGLFKDVDVVIFSHVDSNLRTSWGDASGNALISAEFSFLGEAAHAAGAPWRGRSALDAVELMNVGWNYRREHLEISQRSHYVIPDGGDQPNVVPTTARVWYYFRMPTAAQTQRLFETGVEIAKGAAMMTGTKLDTVKILGSAWHQHFNRPIAEAMAANAQLVGMPQWTEDDQAFARAVQTTMGSTRPSGLATNLGYPLGGPATNQTGGGSDDIGDFSWNFPTVTLRYPANIPGLPGHHWSSAMASATPIAHKGTTAGAKVMAATIIDLMVRPELVPAAKTYFTDVQTRDLKYAPLMRTIDQPAVQLNTDIMARYKPELSKYYYDPAKYKTYMEQLGIKYPVLKKP
jgi:aminobenzoyl-glutamate utilization protein B